MKNNQGFIGIIIAIIAALIIAGGVGYLYINHQNQVAPNSQIDFGTSTSTNTTYQNTGTTTLSNTSSINDITTSNYSSNVILANYNKTDLETQISSRFPGFKIFLPENIPLDKSSNIPYLYGTLDPVSDSNRVSIVFSSDKNCTANACTYALLNITSDQSLIASNVKLNSNINAEYEEGSCGGSCSQPSIIFVYKNEKFDFASELSKQDLINFANIFTSK